MDQNNLNNSLDMNNNTFNNNDNMNNTFVNQNVDNVQQTSNFNTGNNNLVNEEINNSQYTSFDNNQTVNTIPSGEEPKKKKMGLIILLVVLLLIIIVGVVVMFGKKDLSSSNNTTSENSNTNNSEGKNDNNKSLKTIKNIPLKEYKDIDVGYTMLCPDSIKYNYWGSDYWFYYGDSDDAKIFFSFSEYEDIISLFDKDVSTIKDPHEIFDYFMPVMSEVLGYSKKIYLNIEKITDFSWEDITVSGLPAAIFRCTIDVYEKGPRGLTGIAIVGEKRPYLFWAYDFTQDQSYLDMATAVLEAAVENFKEGS